MILKLKSFLLTSKAIHQYPWLIRALIIDNNIVVIQIDIEITPVSKVYLDKFVKNDLNEKHLSYLNALAFSGYSKREKRIFIIYYEGEFQIFKNEVHTNACFWLTIIYFLWVKTLKSKQISPRIGFNIHQLFVPPWFVPATIFLWNAPYMIYISYCIFQTPLVVFDNSIC